MRKLQCISVALLLVSSLSGSSAKPASKQSGVTSEWVAKPALFFQHTSPLKLPLSNPTIVVKKGRRELLLFSDGKLVRTYHIALGLSPTGDKVRQGDRRTPEGSFYIFAKNAKSAFYLSLGLSYPNAEHAALGLRDGLITRPQYNQILNALKRKLTPPQNTVLGGDIYIHGNGAQSDWTWGCVALENEAIRELYQAVQVRTPVVIEP
ncbi:MAG: L,D-transpeptidase [Pyrinomonadaceae bacterium]